MKRYSSGDFKISVISRLSAGDATGYDRVFGTHRIGHDESLSTIAFPEQAGVRPEFGHFLSA